MSPELILVRWLVAFAVTQAVEVPIYMLALRGRFAIAFAASLITHPFVWFAFPLLGRALGLGYLSMVLLAEAFAVGVEALLLHRSGLERAWAWSLSANATSVGVGLASRALIGWP